jgi:predicted transcriptional regulator
VKPGTNVRDAAIKMAEARKAALVVDDGELLGIFTAKDLMCRAVAKLAPLELTAISSLMTPDPETVSPDMTVLEALQTMHDHKFLSLPVCEEDGTVVGMVDVMDLILGCGGAEGWRSIFATAMDSMGDEDGAETASVRSDDRSTVKSQSIVNVAKPPKKVIRAITVPVGPTPLSRYDDIPSSPGQSEISAMAHMIEKDFVFKIVDSDGNTHRIKSANNDIQKLLEAVAEKLGGGAKAGELMLKFIDDEGDAVVIRDDAGLNEAVELQRHAGSSALKLSVTRTKKEESVVVNSAEVSGAAVTNAKSAGKDNMMMYSMIVGGVAILAGAALVLLKPKR